MKSKRGWDKRKMLDQNCKWSNIFLRYKGIIEVLNQKVNARLLDFLKNSSYVPASVKGHYSAVGSSSVATSSFLSFDKNQPATAMEINTA